MAINAVSAVLFAKSLPLVASFYREVLGATTLDRSDHHESLECQGFQLVVRQIPAALAESVVIAAPPERRERTAIRLNFPTQDIGRAREYARRLGGQIDDVPPPWATGSTSIYLGFDPEGNVIGVVPANTSLERTRER